MATDLALWNEAVSLMESGKYKDGKLVFSEFLETIEDSRRPFYVKKFAEVIDGQVENIEQRQAALEVCSQVIAEEKEKLLDRFGDALRSGDYEESDRVKEIILSEVTNETQRDEISGGLDRMEARYTKEREYYAKKRGV